MNISVLAAGAGGMYCGSCMRDNALAVALKRLGHDVTLIPLYTPLRTDAPSAGGVGGSVSRDVTPSRLRWARWRQVSEQNFELDRCGRYGLPHCPHSVACDPAGAERNGWKTGPTVWRMSKRYQATLS